MARIASSALASASCSVSPSVTTSGRAGTSTVKPPPSCGSRMTEKLKFRDIVQLRLPAAGARRGGDGRRRRAFLEFPESHQRKMSERRHRPALDQFDAAVAIGPARDACPGKFRPPAEPARDRREPLLERAPQ